MGLLSIIRKENRTEEDLQLAYRILFKNDHTVTEDIKYTDISDFNSLLDKLKMLSKTRLMQHYYCPFQYKCSGVLRLTQLDRPITVQGRNLHYINDLFWNKTMKPEYFINCSNLRNMLYDRYIDLIPVAERTEFIIKMARSFVEFEVKRIEGIYNELGKSKEVIERYVFPVATELGIENWDRWISGKIDRIDRTTNDCFAVVEYKYGKPKYLDNQYSKTSIYKELGFYAILPQGKNVYVVNEDESMELLSKKFDFKLEFYYGAMVFLKDIQKTGELIKINQNIITNTYKSIKHFWEMMDKGIFKPIPRDTCLDVCQYYWDLCELNPEWLEIDLINENKDEGDYLDEYKV